MKFVNSKYDDKFEATLITSSGKNIALAQQSVNTSEWQQLGGDMFTGGDSTTYHTGWTKVTENISDYAGQLVTLQFHVWDVGDSAYDTCRPD